MSEQVTFRDQGLAFERERDGGVEIEIEYPDYSGWSGVTTGMRYATLTREQWDALVKALAA